MTARRHHFVPQCYLKRFTNTGRKEGNLVVFDRISEKVYETSPENVAVEKDFNRIDLEGRAPDYIESQYGIIESELDIAISEVIEARCFRDETIRYHILYFIAQLLVRHPRMRDSFNEFRKQVVLRTLDIMLFSKERYEKEIAKSGVDNSSAASYEEMKALLDGGMIDVAFSRMSHIEHELDLPRKLVDVLAGRSWCLIDAKSTSGGFISSDHPAILISTRSEKSAYGPGLALANTDVFLPLSPATALIGRFEDQPERGLADIFHVAWRNAQQIAFAKRQVFSVDRSFVYMWPGYLQPFQTADDLIEDERFLRGGVREPPKSQIF